MPFRLYRRKGQFCEQTLKRTKKNAYWAKPIFVGSNKQKHISWFYVIFAWNSLCAAVCDVYVVVEKDPLRWIQFEEFTFKVCGFGRFDPCIRTERTTKTSRRKTCFFVMNVLAIWSSSHAVFRPENIWYFFLSDPSHQDVQSILCHCNMFATRIQNSTITATSTTSTSGPWAPRKPLVMGNEYKSRSGMGWWGWVDD